MSTTVRLKTDLAWKFGQKNIISGAGLVEISSEGIIEVENEEIAKEVEEANIGFYIIGGEKEKHKNELSEELKKKSEENTIQKNTESNELGIGSQENELGSEGSDVEDNKTAGSNTESTVAPNSDLIKALSDKNMDELKDLAKPFPKREWKDFDQAGLVTYLTAKLK